MLARFKEQRVLIDAVLQQQLVRGKRKLAEALASLGKLEEWASGTEIITQGDSDRDLFLILLGEFSVVINGREMAIRTAGQHVGEMTVIDTHALRSASVVARTQSVTLRIPESEFTKLAQGNPDAWRYMASELADRPATWSFCEESEHYADCFYWVFD